jgi:hypothetical protein
MICRIRFWTRSALIAGVAITPLLAACSGEPSAPVESSESETAEPPAAAAETSMSALSADERAAGWQLLFNGESLEHFRGFKMDALPAGWAVSEGTIHFVPPEEGERADLITREQFADFELTLEWAVSEGGNSGIMFRVSEDHDRSYQTGPEMQILHNQGHRDGERPETSAGSNYALEGPPSDVTRPVGEFNEVRLLVDGAKVSQWLNGELQVEYELWSDAWKEQVAASKFAAMPRYGLNESGHIALQDHGDEIWLRNIKIRRID